MEPSVTEPTETIEADATANEGEQAEDTASQLPAEPTIEEKYAALNDQYLRLAADFENFRKRVQAEREALLKYGAQNTIEMLLPVLDNLELGSGSLSEESSPKMLYQSFTMLQQQLLQALQDGGLKQVAPLNQQFDPAQHEAIAQEPSDQPENTIIRVQKSGYQLHDRVLRPAQVVVSAPPAEHNEPAADTPTEFEAKADNPFSA